MIITGIESNDQRDATITYRIDIVYVRMSCDIVTLCHDTVQHHDHEHTSHNSFTTFMFNNTQSHCAGRYHYSQYITRLTL